MTRIAKTLLFFPIIVFLLSGCTSSLEDSLPGSDDQTVTYHSSGWKDNPQHGSDYSTNPQHCKACHGEDLKGGSSGISCAACHHGWSGSHGDAFRENPDSCKACHGESIEWCSDCHHSGWTGTHGEEYAADSDNCKACHGEDLNGDGDQNRDCSFCHHEEAVGQWQHGDYHTLPDTDNCTDCHGADFTGANSLVSCFSCHGEISAFNCSDCHTGAASSYTDSAHGNTSYGVDRSGTGTEGDCTHCHDLPAGSTNKLLLFAPMNQASQTENFCFQCHKDTLDSPVQIGMPQQHSYSYRAGGWTADPLDDVKETFSSTSSHNLGNILTFITGRWGYTSDSNPCAACHNPHAAQRDLHTVGNRGWPVTLPSKHGSSVADEVLWGDDAEEKMSAYTNPNLYQAPYRFGGDGDDYEPDDSNTVDGSNLACYVTFCQDCHTTNMGSGLYNFGLDHTPIDWATIGGESGGDKHGINAATAGVDLNEPYALAWGSTNGLVLSCADCHEPHGSSNVMLIRREVNGETLADIGSFYPVGGCWESLCERCHFVGDGGYYDIHHASADAPYPPEHCGTCHSNDDGIGNNTYFFYCTRCHFHGGDDSYLNQIGAGSYYTGRRTF